MMFKIIDTTDDRHEGETFEFNGSVTPGEVLTYKDLHMKVETVKWFSPRVVKISSANYIAVLKVVG